MCIGSITEPVHISTVKVSHHKNVPLIRCFLQILKFGIIVIRSIKVRKYTTHEKSVTRLINNNLYQLKFQRMKVAFFQMNDCFSIPAVRIIAAVSISGIYILEVQKHHWGMFLSKNQK